jgi:hypothetical protein
VIRNAGETVGKARGGRGFAVVLAACGAACAAAWAAAGCADAGRDDALGFGNRDPEAPIIDSLDASSLQVSPNDAVQFSVEAHDPLGRGLAYEWRANGGVFRSSTTAPTIEWDAPGTGGQFEVGVRVVNDLGLDEIGSLVVTVISKDLPEVAFVQPVSGASVPALGTLEVRVQATHPNGVQRVEFFRDGELVHTDSAGPDFTWKWSLDGVSGAFELRAQAYSLFAIDRPGIADAKVSVEPVVVP